MLQVDLASFRDLMSFRVEYPQASSVSGAVLGRDAVKQATKSYEVMNKQGEGLFRKSTSQYSLLTAVTSGSVESL